MSYMGQMRRSLRTAFRKKHKGEPMPLAPLRAISYVSAGGSFAAIVGDQPASAVMKVGYKQGSGNVYTNKVVLLDEAHNLVRSETRYADQLRRLQAFLLSAESIVLAGFTGTPILDKPEEGRLLLNIVKGTSVNDCDEGFLSSFPARPRPIFPESLPRGIPDGMLTTQRTRELVRKVELSGEALRAYEIKRRLGHTGPRLQNYCNLSVWTGSFHDGKSGSKARVLAHPEDCCPKLWAAARAVAASTKKAVVLTGRTSGYAVMLTLLQQLGAKHKFGIATMDELAEFNHVDNLQGKKYRVLVADTLQCSEGVSFLAVRRMILTDVPNSPTQLVQQVGRAIRLYSHKGLPEKEQTVTSSLYVATLPAWTRPPLTYWASTAQRMPQCGKDLERLARRLASQLKRAGFGDVGRLKAAIDKHARGKAILTCKDVSAFLEDHGLWEEARQLQHFEKKEAEAAKNDGSAEFDEALKLVEMSLADLKVAVAPRPGQKRKEWRKPLQSRLVDLGKSDIGAAATKEVAPTLSSAMEGDPLPADAAAVTEELQALLGELRARRAQVASPPVANPFVHALNALRSCDAEAAAAKPTSADEAALRQLSTRSREFAPALATLRSTAVDKEFFGYLAEKLDEMEDDDEEESDEGNNSEQEPIDGKIEEADAVMEPEAPPPRPEPKRAAVFGLWTQELESLDPVPEVQGRKRLRRKTPQPDGLDSCFQQQPSSKNRRGIA